MKNPPVLARGWWVFSFYAILLGMTCITFFLRHKDWACLKVSEAGTTLPARAHYQFNCGEKTGNVLLIPLAKVAEWFQQSDSLLFKGVLLIVGLVALVFAFFGLIIKKIAECDNPKSALRNQALDQLSIIHNLSVRGSREERLQALEAKREEVETLFRTNILQKDPRRQTLQSQWRAIWVGLKDKIDYSAWGAAFSPLVSHDPQIMRALDSYFQELTNERALKNAGKEYNRIIELMDNLEDSCTIFFFARA